MAWFQEWFGEDYLDLYSHRDASEAKQQVAFFKHLCGTVNGAVLDLAFGPGRPIRELEESGYRAVGVAPAYMLLRTGDSERGPTPRARARRRFQNRRDGTPIPQRRNEARPDTQLP